MSTQRPDPGGRTALLEAAISITADRGLRGLTYRAVSERAGVSHGLVRHHFGSREALIAETLSFGVERAITDTGVVPPAASPSEFADDMVELVLQYAELHAFQYEIALEARRRPELLPLVTQQVRGFRNAIAAQLRTFGITDQAVAAPIWAALDGITFRLIVDGDRDNAEATLEGLRAHLRTLADG